MPAGWPGIVALQVLLFRSIILFFVVVQLLVVYVKFAFLRVSPLVKKSSAIGSLGWTLFGIASVGVKVNLSNFVFSRNSTSPEPSSPISTS